MAADHLQILDCPFTSDHGPQHDSSLNAGLFRQRWILGLHAANQIAFHYVRDPRRTHRWRLWKERPHAVAKRVKHRASASVIAGASQKPWPDGQLWRVSIRFMAVEIRKCSRNRRRNPQSVFIKVADD